MNNPNWAKLPNETSKAYESFECYLHLGARRSIQKAGKWLAKNHKSLARLSKKYQWTARARAFDEYVSERKSEEMVAERIDMERRHAREAQLFQEIALEPLIELHNRIGNGESLWNDENYNPLETLKITKMVPQYFKMYREAAKMEQTARGPEEKNTEPNPITTDINCLIDSAEFLKAIEGLIEKKIREKISGYQGTQRNDEIGVAGERGDESRENPAHTPVLRRKGKVFFDEE